MWVFYVHLYLVLAGGTFLRVWDVGTMNECRTCGRGKSKGEGVGGGFKRREERREKGSKSDTYLEEQLDYSECIS